MRKRFDDIAILIYKAITERDCFGMQESSSLGVFQELPATRAFAFATSAEKIQAFMAWLQEQVDRGILTVGLARQLGQAVQEAWTDMYLLDSYKRGVLRARYELKRAGYDVPSIEASGGIDVAMNTVFHMDRVGLIFIRAYNELKGVTDAMGMQISRVLAQGMADGDGPRTVARKLVTTITGRGDTLGVRDSLGRWIPAKRRAEMIARTEMIRAHHVATIQEYRNWGVLGIRVLAEWVTAGDDRVCDVCASLEGKKFTLDEVEGMIPVHPNCFIDKQIPIYTSEGWKSIGDVEIGDLVLTHKRRFKKVYALPRHQEQANVVTFKFKGGLNLSMTENHPVLVEGGTWKPAKDCVEGEKIMLLGNTCKRCGEPIPYFRKYCSRTCLSKDITEKQWNDPKHRENISKKVRKNMLEQYATGERDGSKITEKAHVAIREMVKKGAHPFQDSEVNKKAQLTANTPENIKRNSERMKNNNPMKDPVVKEKARKSLEKLYAEHPEKRLNVRMAKHRKSGVFTWIEKRMSLCLDKMGIQYVSQYPVLRYNLDFAIPELKIGIECDGEQWHQDKEKERIRQERLEKKGWSVLHYSGAQINQHIDEIELELTRILCNHLGDYQLVPWEVESIKHWKMKRKMPMYNLSVEEDESYVAKGVVVHNCRCMCLPWEKGDD
jgi:SPP1 gp7 family putative phage head morphogenesis protein